MIEAAQRARGKFHLFECYPFYPPVVKANVQKLKELATERRGCE